MALVETTTEHGICTLTFNNPERLNALTTGMLAEALDALRAALEGGARAIVLTGKGRAFSAGADLANFSETLERGSDVLASETGERMKKISNPFTLLLAECPVPVVSAVNGPCVGGSVGIALAADIVIAAKSAYFMITQVAALGVMPDLGATWQYPHKVGRARALGAMLLGERISAERAEAWGLIWRCVDDASLIDEAMKIARRLADTSAPAVRAARKLVDAAPRTTLEEALEAERLLQIEFLGTDDLRKAVERFVTKAAKS